VTHLFSGHRDTATPVRRAQLGQHHAWTVALPSLLLAPHTLGNPGHGLDHANLISDKGACVAWSMAGSWCTVALRVALQKTCRIGAFTSAPRATLSARVGEASSDRLIHSVASGPWVGTQTLIFS
jgi:hypothetical protein